MAFLPHLAFGAYALVGRLAQPFLRGMLDRRARRGKEEPARLGERWGRASRPRPEGPLIWVHAASVGESLAVLPLVERLAARPGAPAILMTSGTVTSAHLLAERLPPGAIHQFVPLDVPSAVNRFLDHWRPSLGLFVESELWPVLVRRTASRGIALALINARMSAASFRSWRRWQPLARALLESFSLVLAEGDDSAERFRRLGARTVTAPGNLKLAAGSLPGDPAALLQLEALLGRRPRWVAASTHPGEELLVAEAHRLIAARHPGLVTVVAPRHPQRGGEVAEIFAGAGLRVARRSLGEAIGPETQIYLADTLGELGLLYRLSQVVFVGNSLLPGGGGHNLLEPARLGAAVVTGPHTANFAEVAERLRAVGGLLEAKDAASLAETIDRLLSDAQKRTALAAAARAATQAEETVLERTLAALEPLVARLAA